MMKLELKESYKSLEPFTIDLPDFVVLTGVNGAGKTQLLEAIKENGSLVYSADGNLIRHIMYFNRESLSINQDLISDRTQLINDARKAFDRYLSYNKKKDSKPGLFYENGYANHHPSARIINHVAKASNKGFDNLTENDFHEFYPIDAELISDDIFYKNISTLFRRYQDKLEQNNLNEFRRTQKGQDDIHYLTQEEFIKLYDKAPWDAMNEILESAQLDYRVESPINIHRDAPFEVTLTNRLNNIAIQYNDLSSGEKVVMSLLFALYNSSFEVAIPNILLLDEPDASLHPSMSKLLLRVIQTVFIETKKIKVIMTTHSPSTVALAPEETIYIMNKVAPRLEKASKDKALRILTANVPSFSVNYENRRQVFVESPYDVSYYEGIYKILLKQLAQEISLSFISSGDSRTDKNGIPVANCGQVINISTILRDSGNRFVWGIIDYDKTNHSNAFVKVLGEGNRYSIENYILDPLLIAVLLLRENLIDKKKLGLVNNEKYIDLKAFDIKQLQSMADSVINEVASHVKDKSGISSTVTLLDEQTLEIPNWYLMHQGHSLEEVILKAFPMLSSVKKKSEDGLKLAIIDKVLTDSPELMSIDFLNVFKAIQEG